MLNKKTIIIIVLAFIIFFTSATLVFFLFKRVENKAILNKTNPNITDELKSNHPEFSSAQLKFYADTAVTGSMVPCENRADVNNCISSVAFIKMSDRVCGEMDNAKSQIKCSVAVLTKTGASEISKCDSLNDDNLKTQCLANIFQLYKRPEDCSGFKGSVVQEKCEAVTYLIEALLQSDKKLCDNIKDEYLKFYCVKR